MIFAALLLVAQPEPLSLEPFADEETAGIALEKQMFCLGNEAFERRSDQQPPSTVAAEIVAKCRASAEALQVALADVFMRKPELLRSGQKADAAAQLYVSEMNARIQLVVEEGRKKK